MAIIKCPECGHSVSERAPLCPSCGAEIAGKVTTCKQCGTTYFNDASTCPKCGHPTHDTNTLANRQAVSSQPPTYKPVSQATAPKQAPPRKQGKAGIILVAFLVAVAILGAFFYFYNNANSKKEQEAYEYAMQSNDPMVLESFLRTYTEASQAHTDSIKARLERLNTTEQDWTNALVNGTKAALLGYLDKYPDTHHKDAIMTKVDSIDWEQAVTENTFDSYQHYMDEHGNGNHYNDASNAMKTLKANTVQPEEKTAIAQIFRKFFQSINAKDEEGLTSTVATFLPSFLGKSDANKTDVVNFMHKLWKEDITNMNWRLNNDYNITKKEIGEEEYEYTVQFSAVLNMERTDASKEKTANYKITAKIDPSAKITEFNMVKILQ